VTSKGLAIVLFAVWVGFPAAPARAFDFFGLFGAPEKAEPSPDTIAYDISFTGLDEADGLAQNLKEASNGWRLRLESPSTGVELARRVVADFPRLAAALWANGYYNATVHAEVAGTLVEPDGRGTEAAALAAQIYKGAALAPVVFTIALGPQFRLRSLEVLDARTHAPIDRALLSQKALEWPEGEPARAATLVARQAQWVDELRASSYPLAKIVAAKPVVRHDAHVVDVTFILDPGPRAGVGDVRLDGSPNIDPAVIRSFVYLEEGEAYSPKRLAETRKSVAQIEAVGGVKVEDAQDHLDAAGNMPILVQTTERKEHALGVSANYANTDGPALRGYWTDRNLFGGAERLRFDVEGGLAPIGGASAAPNLSDVKWSDVIGRASASFLKPALFGSRDDLLVDAAAVRERTDYYAANYGTGTIALRHRLAETVSVQGGLQIEGGDTFDAWGRHDYTLLGFPLAANYDSTDSPMAPTRGIRAVANVTPYVKALPNSVGMVQSKGQVSGYWALDDDAWRILAGRLTLGSIVGADIADIPASHRFFAGGGGSVRGYVYKSISPDNGFGFPTGGRSLFETSGEARLKITQTIGVVPFVDAGAAYATPYPDFGSTLRVGAGAGLRYYTPIGPIRLDAATPVNRRPGDGKLAIFIGLGESF
jgi:translocation and assembly module TamA